MWLAVDHLCCLERLYQPMAAFLTENNTTSIQVIETSLSKTTEMVTQELADVAIINLPITNYSAEAFGFTMMEPVVASSHPFSKCRFSVVESTVVFAANCGGEI